MSNVWRSEVKWQLRHRYGLSSERVAAAMAKYDRQIDRAMQEGQGAHKVAAFIAARPPAPKAKTPAKSAKSPAKGTARETPRAKRAPTRKLPEGWKPGKKSGPGLECFAEIPKIGRSLGHLKLTQAWRGMETHARPYSVCMTRSQVKRLMAGRPVTRKLGEGAFAAVWAKGDDKVLKITHDIQDVAGTLRAGRLKHVRAADKVYWLVDAGHDYMTGRPTPVFAIIADEVTPFDSPKYDDTYRLWASGVMGYGTNVALEEADHWDRIGRPIKDFKLSSEARAVLEEHCQDVAMEDERACRRFSREFADTWEKLAQRGILFADTHPGNFGVDEKTGTWKIIDIGLSRTDIPAGKVIELRDVMKRWASRSRRSRPTGKIVTVLGIAALIALAPLVRATISS